MNKEQRDKIDFLISDLEYGSNLHLSTGQYYRKLSHNMQELMRVLVDVVNGYDTAKATREAEDQGQALARGEGMG